MTLLSSSPGSGNSYITLRLVLYKLTLLDSEFISELVNTAEWIQFIGDRNIKTKQGADEYVQKIMDNPAINYWVVKTRDTQIPVGIITLIKRDYLDYPDIGFAFLNRFTKQGYAYEATAAVVNDVMTQHKRILAITMKENINSIRLLEKLRFRFDKNIQHEDETLQVYCLV